MGNICRSPMAEGMFRRLAEAAGLDSRFEVASAAIGPWHVGERPDARMREVARRHGIELTGRARQVRRDELGNFDLILAMDREVRGDLLNMTRTEAERKKIRLMREFDPRADGDLDVPDPYYGDPDSFDQVYAIVERSARRLLEHLSQSDVGG